MKDELSALQKTSTWELVSLPVGKNLVGCKWVYKVKTHSNGSLEHCKARLVVKGFSQEYGIDYEKTFAPVAKMTTVRTLISVVSVFVIGLFIRWMLRMLFLGLVWELSFLAKKPKSY